MRDFVPVWRLVGGVIFAAGDILSPAACALVGLRVGVAVLFLFGFAAGSAAVFHLQEDIVVDKFSYREAGGREFYCGVGGGALVAEDLDAVPPCGSDCAECADRESV